MYIEMNPTGLTLSDLIRKTIFKLLDVWQKSKTPERPIVRRSRDDARRDLTRKQTARSFSFPLPHTLTPYTISLLTGESMRASLYMPSRRTGQKMS